MKASFTANPVMLFLDATYNVNAEKFCLYAILCEDVNGIGQPVFLGLMSSEKAENLDCYFKSFNVAHPTWEQVECVFTDKDFQEIAMVKKELPQARPLLCVFHVIKWMKGQIARVKNCRKKVV